MSPTVYVMRSSAGDVLYIGQSAQPGKRFNAHGASSGWWTDVASIEITHCPTRSEAIELERSLIEGLSPQHNIRLNGERSKQVTRLAHEQRRRRQAKAHAAGHLCDYMPCKVCRARRAAA